MFVPASVNMPPPILIRLPLPLRTPEYVVVTPLLPAERATPAEAVLVRLRLPPLVRPPKVAEVRPPKLNVPPPLVSSVLD